jgi:hypothetical protein
MHEAGARGSGLDLPHRLPARTVVEVGDGDGCPLPGQPQRSGPADAGPSPGHERDASGDLHGVSMTAGYDSEGGAGACCRPLAAERPQQRRGRHDVGTRLPGMLLHPTVGRGHDHRHFYREVRGLAHDDRVGLLTLR